MLELKIIKKYNIIYNFMRIKVKTSLVIQHFQTSLGYPGGLRFWQLCNHLIIYATFFYKHLTIFTTCTH